MKLTKVNSMRLAVSSIERREGGKGVIYVNPNESQKTTTIKSQVESRIEQANKLYNVFFRNDIPDTLDKLFEELVNRVRNSTNMKDAENIVKEYNGTYGLELKHFMYSCKKKKIENVMELYVREKLSDSWQSNVNRNSAVRILCCLCNGKKYKANIEKVDKEIIKNFINTCKNLKGKTYVYPLNKLETAFSEIIKLTARQCNTSLYIDVERPRQDISVQNDIIKQIEYMKKLTFYQNGKKEQIFLKDIFHNSTTDDRLDAVLVRMRKSLKRGDNHDVAIKLLKALASKEDRWENQINAMLKDDDNRQKLYKFIYSINMDYHKMSLIRSVEKINVKIDVKSKEDKKTNLLILSNAEDEKKKGLYQTLNQYACSADASNEILIKIKKIVFAYFIGDNRKEYEDRYFSVEKLWKFPQYPSYFGDDFDCKEESIKLEAKTKLAQLLEPIESKVDMAAIKQQIRYVNYGAYKGLMEAYTDDISVYWIRYIKEFVDKNYIDKSVKSCRPETLYSTAMMKKCWNNIIQQICAQYINLGKIVYHCAMPEQLKPRGEMQYGLVNEQYRNGISSFDYEDIKAEENLQKSMAEVVSNAVSNFAGSILDYSKNLVGKEDVLALKFEIGATDTKLLCANAKKQLLRYFGGESNCVCIDSNVSKEELAEEIQGLLYEIRNQSFHYKTSVKTVLSYNLIEKLFENDLDVYVKVIKDMYYTNNIARFYPQKCIIDLINELYRESHIREAQIPAFATIFKKISLPEYIAKNIKEKNVGMIESKSIATEKEIYGGALYFILKELYYQKFTVDKIAVQYFYNAVYEYFQEQGGEIVSGNYKYAISKQKLDACEGSIKKFNKCYPYYNAAKGFLQYVDRVKNSLLTLGEVCQLILTEYNQQNAKANQDEAVFKHYKLLLEKCMRLAFEKYVDDYYSFIKTPSIQSDDALLTYLDVEINGMPVVNIGCLKYLQQMTSETDKELKQMRYMWYVLGHFIHPRQLNFLIGDLKNYIQFKHDIVKRSFYAGEIDARERQKSEQELDTKLQNIREILTVLEFVRNVSGKVSAQLTDYYIDENEYAKFLKEYIDYDIIPQRSEWESFVIFCNKTLPDDKVIDIYADAKNPKVLRNVELSRMYAGGDWKIPIESRISKNDILKYYQEKDGVQNILSRGLCQNEKEQLRVRQQQELKEKITLNDITVIRQIINDLHSRLVSMAYLRERDEMYLLLGFYYMALQNSEGWKGNDLNSIATNEFSIKSGLILYQVVSVFTAGLVPINSLCDERSMLSTKLMQVYNQYRQSCAYALRLFDNDELDKEINQTRNYVDHFKYYSLHDKSMLELYNAFYKGLFSYSNMLQKSVWNNFISILAKEHIGVKLKTMDNNGKYFFMLKDDKLFSEKFTYKLADKKTVIEINARGEDFLKKLYSYLLYKVV